MRFFILSALFLVGSLGLLLPASAQTMVEIREAVGDELSKADAKLNRVYQKVLKENADNPDFCSDLREAQRAWLKYAEYHLKTLFPVGPGENASVLYGTMYPVDLGEAKIALTVKRTTELEALLKN